MTGHWITILALTFAALSFSAQAKAEEQSDDCDGSTVEMHECIAAKLAIADKELNTVYQAIRVDLQKRMQSTDPMTSRDAKEIDARLVKAQRAWIAFRDADCDLEGVQMLNGTGEGLIIHGCHLGKTEERVKALKNVQF